MKKVAIIPLRKGSQGIPNKNKKKMLGRPLYQWALGEAIFSELDKIYVFTDDDEILADVNEEYRWTNKVEAIRRSAESATDTASTAFAMVELAEKINYDFDVFCVLQATSPLQTREDINKVLKKIENENYDSALTVVEAKRFIWSEKGESLNYDFMKRPRRQEHKAMLIENGAVYAITKQMFLKTKNSLGGKIAVVPMAEESLYEIDEPCDWDIVEILLKQREMKRKKFDKIKYLVLDIDGVFTDGTVAVNHEGDFSKSFSLRDDMGLELLHLAGVQPIVMTPENNTIVTKQMEKLKIDAVFLGVKDKYTKLEAFLMEQKSNKNHVAYVGDDINDLSNVCSVGVSFCPSDALDEVKDCTDYVLHNKGGDKAIREAISVIKKHNKRF